MHVAIRQGETAAFHALGQSPEPIMYDHLLGVVFTDPQVATVGLLPAELEKEALSFCPPIILSMIMGKSILMEAKHGYVAVHADKKTGVVLGAECVGKDAGELIQTCPSPSPSRQRFINWPRRIGTTRRFRKFGLIRLRTWPRKFPKAFRKSRIT